MHMHTFLGHEVSPRKVLTGYSIGPLRNGNQDTFSLGFTPPKSEPLLPLTPSLYVLCLCLYVFSSPGKIWIEHEQDCLTSCRQQMTTSVHLPSHRPMLSRLRHGLGPARRREKAESPVRSSALQGLASRLPFKTSRCPPGRVHASVRRCFRMAAGHTGPPPLNRPNRSVLEPRCGS